MRIVFFGTSDFAVPSLERLMGKGHELCAVVTQPSRRKGRSLALAEPPVKILLNGGSIPIYQPQEASGEAITKALLTYEPDLFVVVEFGQILKESSLKIPKKFCLNLHASLLPEYRGAAPINWSVINGDKKTGLTTMRMDARMDAGDIILQREADISDYDTSQTLRPKLAAIGAELLLETIEIIAAGKALFTKQDEKKATYAPKLKKEDGLIDWSMSARDIHNRVRGLAPWPSAYTHWKEKLIKIWSSEAASQPASKDGIGIIAQVDKNGITVGTGTGYLIIKELQLEGGKRLAADTFLRGHSIRIGDILR